MANSTNPLAKHFRQAQLYLKLPSQGRWYPPGSLEMPVTGELPVFPMTAKDELILKTPDALLNGQSTVEVIQSCVPAIKDAWKMPSIDLDAVLIAIRHATYGTGMDFVSVCPHCKRKNENTVDLSVLSGQITCPDFESTIKVEGLEIYLRPQTYQQFNKASLENYEQQRLLAVVNDNSLSEEEKLSQFNNVFKRLLNLTVEQVSKSVAAIKTEEGVLVEDESQLHDFFQNCNKTVWDAVKTKLESFGDQSPLKKVPVVCEHEDCAKAYETPLVFEQSSFFV
jgi:hypothetical protein